MSETDIKQIVNPNESNDSVSSSDTAFPEDTKTEKAELNENTTKHTRDRAHLDRGIRRHSSYIDDERRAQSHTPHDRLPSNSSKRRTIPDKPPRASSSRPKSDSFHFRTSSARSTRKSKPKTDKRSSRHRSRSSNALQRQTTVPTPRRQSQTKTQARYSEPRSNVRYSRKGRVKRLKQKGKRFLGWLTKKGKSLKGKRSRSSNADAFDKLNMSYDVSKKRMAEMKPSALFAALKQALHAYHPKALMLFKRLSQKDTDGIDLEKELHPRHMRRLAYLGLTHVDDGPEPLLVVLRAMARRKRSPVQVDCLYTKRSSKRIPISLTSSTSRYPIPFLIAGNKRLSSDEKRNWLDAIMNDADVGHLFDLNRNIGKSGNLLLNSYTKLKIDDPKWYTHLIQDYHIAVNTQTTHNQTLKDLLESETDSCLTNDARETVVRALDAHGGKTANELAAG